MDESLREKPSPRPGVKRVAVHQPFPLQALSLGSWQQLADGTRVWRLAVHSTNALGLRIHFQRFSAGAGQVWVHDTHSPALKMLGPYTGSGPLGTRDFWTGTVIADTVEIEYQPPSSPTDNASALPFIIGEVIHVWRLGQIESPKFGTAAASASEPDISCFLDATCYSSNSAVKNASNATAMILFGDYECSATLLNAPNQVPMLLTAGHCVNTEQDAEGTETFFQYQTTTCGDPPTYPNLFSTANGVRLLSSSNRPFLDGSQPDQIYQDLDYSLIQLDSYPLDPVLPANYATIDLSIGDPAISVSHPYGLPMRVAFGTRVAGSISDGSYFDNAYEIDLTTNGRIDHGSSGSGIFNNDGALVGVLSTGEGCPNPKPDGSCPANYTSCQASAPFDTFYTKFSAIYPHITAFLNKPLKSPDSNPSLFWASPNPINVTDGSGLGQTTLYFDAPDKSAVEVRVGSPSGPLLSLTGGVGQAQTAKWVTDGMVFYLQDATQGDSTSSTNTLATVTASFSTATFIAFPVVLPTNNYNSTTLSWSAPNSQSVEIWAGSSAGPQTLFARSAPFGILTTPPWATPGLSFFLLDSTSKQILSSFTLQGAFNYMPAPGYEYGIYATPDPIFVPANGPALGQTTLEWFVPLSIGLVQVRVGASDGPLFAESYGSSSAPTTLWVTDGMTFYLVQPDGYGNPNTVFATTTVHVTPQ